jgi:alpha-mannosidase
MTMKKYPVQTLERCNVFIKEFLSPHLHEKEGVVRVEACFFKYPASFSEMKKAKFAEKKTPFNWGPHWTTGWFKLSFDWQKPVDEDCDAALFVDMIGDGCLFSEKGTVLQSIDTNHKSFFLRGKHGKTVLYMDATAAHTFGISVSRLSPNLDDVSFQAQIKEAAIVKIDRIFWKFYNVFEALFLLVKNLPEESTYRAQLLSALNDSINLFELGDKERLKKALAYLEKFIKAHPAEPSAHTAFSQGHSHIDVAWLWPLSETVKKCARTFSSMCLLLDEGHGFVFSQGQAQLYDYTKKNYPGLYARIKNHIKTGLWENASSCWVEFDCNIISGESMVRQFLYGQRFSRDEFGKTVDHLWLPDVFGYSAAMPQILTKCGVNYFSTQKLSWSTFNKFPHHSFKWRGIDGTEILSHFLPANNYNGLMTADELRFSAKNFKDSDRLSEWVYPFGWGDGGGGVDRKMLEKMEVYRNLEGVPKIKTSTVTDFFRDLSSKKIKFPVWTGELYLEYHRGTYTTQAWIKKANRKNEILLQNLEKTAAFFGNKSDYPAQELNEMWKTLLLNQFHDIIPGSSIGKVYDDAKKRPRKNQQDGNRPVEFVNRKGLSGFSNRGDEVPRPVA